MAKPADKKWHADAMPLPLPAAAPLAPIVLGADDDAARRGAAPKTKFCVFIGLGTTLDSFSRMSISPNRCTHVLIALKTIWC